MSESQGAMQDRIYDGEFRNLRENLIFYSIPEGAVTTAGNVSKKSTPTHDTVEMSITEQDIPSEIGLETCETVH